MKTIATIATVLLLTTSVYSCPGLTIIAGHYQSVQLGMADRALYFLKGVKRFAMGVDLVIKADSTFTYQTCRRKGTKSGKWAVKNNSLFLTVDATSSQGDGMTGKLQKAKNIYMMEYAIDGDRLHHIERSNIGPIVFLLAKETSAQ